MLALLTDDVAHDINQGGREIGKDAFRRFLAHMDRCCEELRDIVVMASRTAAVPPLSSRSTAPISSPTRSLPPASGQTYTVPAGTFFALEVARSRA